MSDNIFISMTTLPERLNSDFFKKVISNILDQSIQPTIIILNIPYIYKRTNEKYIIPRWITNHNYIKINRCLDLGPATKILGNFQNFLPNDTICIMDDDIIYKEDTIKNLYLKLLQNINSIITVDKDKNNSPTGYSGYMFKKKYLKITQLDIKDLLLNSFDIDDTWLGKICRNHGVKILELSNNEKNNSGIDVKLTDTHPEWYELCKNTDRQYLINKCLNSKINYTHNDTYL